MRLLAPVASVAPDVDVGGEFVRILISLAGVIGLIMLAGWFSRRMQVRTGMGRRLRIVECVGLGARERIMLVDANGKRLLLGVGHGGVRTLHVYEGDAPNDEMQAIAPVSFKTLMAQWKGKP